MLSERTCDLCGCVFHVTAKQMRDSPCRFCSRSCSGKWRSSQNVGGFASTDELRRLYVAEGMTLEQIGTSYGVTPQAVAYHLERAGIRRRPPTGANLRAPEVVAKSTANHRRGERHHAFRGIPNDEIVALYTNGLTTTQIAARYGVAATSIQRHLRDAGVQLRRPGFGSWQLAADGHAVQSGWELLVDNWLSEHGIEHITQPNLPFGRNQRGDFFALGWYIEVWGIVHNDRYAERKREKIAAYHNARMPLIELYPRHIEREDFAPLHVLLNEAA